MGHASKMTLSLVATDHDELCHGWSWEIEDEEELVDQVARVTLGQYRHISKVLQRLAPRPPTTTAEHVADALDKLALDADGSSSKRDGWIFQVISWIAANANRGNAFIRAPHIRKADHGFDGMQLEMSPDGSTVSAVVIFEDKATTSPRSTVTKKVWPEVKKLEIGQRITELTHEVTSMLEAIHGSASDFAIEEAVENIIWKNARRYRISITVGDEHVDQRARKGLFKGFNDRVSGNVNRRRAETICIPNMRDWMEAFTDKVESRISELAPHV